MLPGKKYTPEDMLRIAARRWWMILLPFVIGTFGGTLVYQRMPVQYRSETLIMVVPQRVPDRIVQPTISGTIEDRLPSINEQILSRSRLERTILEFDLYPEQRARGIMEDVVQRMRGDIQVQLDAWGKELFRVSYSNVDPRTAQKVTERLASMYIEENLRDRENLTQSTSVFLESQLEDAKRRLIEQEKRLEAYRRRHAGQLPSQVSSNLQAMQSAQMQLQTVGEAINRARERRLLVERQLADVQTLPPALLAPGVAASGEEPVQLTPAQQLENATARLEASRLRYTADHPDVRALERTIRELRVKVEEDAKRTTAPDTRAATPEAVRQRRIGDLDAELEILDRQIATSEADQVRLRQAISEYTAKLDVLPTRESELVELTRDYSTLQETYATLSMKREEAMLAANLERRQGGEQFRVLDPASFPEKPSNEKQRLGALAAGALGGLALGLALVGFLEYRDSSFKTENDVVRVLSLPVLALVPVMMSAHDRRDLARRSRRVAACVVALVIVLGSAAGLAVWGLRP
jgi:polysaccharide chain length determinant protein (PEP-CTERM system associated)